MVCLLSAGHQRKLSANRSGSCNPVWNEVFRFAIDSSEGDLVIQVQRSAAVVHCMFPRPCPTSLLARTPHGLMYNPSPCNLSGDIQKEDRGLLLHKTEQGQGARSSGRFAGAGGLRRRKTRTRSRDPVNDISALHAAALVSAAACYAVQCLPASLLLLTAVCSLCATAANGAAAAAATVGGAPNSFVRLTFGGNAILLLLAARKRQSLSVVLMIFCMKEDWRRFWLL